MKKVRIVNIAAVSYNSRDAKTNIVVVNIEQSTVLLTPIPYLPTVSWFVTLLSYSNVCWHVGELYDKRQPRNRCKIATANGSQFLSVPLVNGRDQHKSLSEIRPVYDDGKWQREHIHALQTAYGRAPYFIHFAEELFAVILQQHDSLASLNLSLVHMLLKRFGMTLNETHDSTATKPFVKETFVLKYRQVFSDRTGFVNDCAAVDLLFNYGPDSKLVMSKALEL